MKPPENVLDQDWRICAAGEHLTRDRNDLRCSHGVAFTRISLRQFVFKECMRQLLGVVKAAADNCPHSQCPMAGSGDPAMTEKCPLETCPMKKKARAMRRPTCRSSQ